MNAAYRDDLVDFIRNNKLDGYELTDEELAQFLEVWRWSVWTHRATPTGPDYEINDAVQHLRRYLASNHNIEVEYNTVLLLKQEIEPLMYWKVLRDLPRALRYFLGLKGLLSLVRTWRQVRRYNQLEPARDAYANPLGYPVSAMCEYRDKAPDLLKRPYWHPIGLQTLEDWLSLDDWW